MYARGTRRGFTLIELLVVIAIIAILAAILFPVFTSARESGRQAQCLSNLSQLGKAMQAYADDWNRFLPRDWHTSTHESYAGWMGRYAIDVKPEKGQLFPYIKNTGIFLCPTDKNVPAKATQFYVTPEEQKKCPVSYSMNAKMSLRNLDTLQARGNPNTGKNRRHSMIYLLVHEPRHRIQDTSSDPWHVNATNDFNMHNKGTTLLFADTHAKWWPGNKVWDAAKKRLFDPDYL